MAARAPEQRNGRWRRRAQLVIFGHPLLSVFALAFAVRGVAATVLWLVSDGTLFNDDAHYHSMTSDWVEGRTEAWSEFTERLFVDTWAFTWPLTALKTVFGTSALVGQLGVAIAGSLVAVLCTWLAREVVSTRWAVVAGVVLAVLPSQVLWSSLMLKDAFAWLGMLAVAVLAAVALARTSGRRWPLLVAILAVLVLLDGVRFHSMVIAAWSLVAAVAVASHPARRSDLAWAIGVALVLPAVLGHGIAGADLVLGRSLTAQRALNAIDAETAVVAPVITPSEAATRADEQEREAARAAQAARELEQRAAEAAGPSTPPPPTTATTSRPSTTSSTTGAQPTTTADPRPTTTVAPTTTTATSTPTTTTSSSTTTTTAATAPTSSSPTTAATTDAAVLLEEAERLRNEAEIAAARASELRETAALAASSDEPVIDAAFGKGEKLDVGVGSDLRYLPRGLDLMLLRPHPWRSASNANVAIARAEQLLWYPLMAAALLGLSAAWRRRRVLTVPVVAGTAFLFASALTEGNFGTAYRHRSEFVWVVVLLAVLGLSEVVERFRSRHHAQVHDDLEQGRDDAALSTIA